MDYKSLGININPDKCWGIVWGNGKGKQCSYNKKNGNYCSKHIKCLECGDIYNVVKNPMKGIPLKPHTWNINKKYNSQSDKKCDKKSNKKDDIVSEYNSMEDSSSDFSDLSINITNILTKDEKSKGGIFFTPKSIIKQDIDYIFSIKSDIKTILEPSCGSCEFINYLDKLYDNFVIDGVEFNHKIYNNIKDLKFKNKVVLHNKDFLKYSIIKKYDLICGNPPYFVYSRDKIPKEYLEYISGRPNIYLIFILKCIDLLNKDGILSFVLPNNFLNCSYYNLVREKICDEFNILKIINHKSDTYLETEQETCSLIIQKKPLYHKKIHNMTIFNSTENINKIEELQINSSTLEEMGFEVFVGKCVWNQEKDILTDDNTKTLLVYSGDIKDNELNIINYTNPEKKNYINRSGEKGPLLVVNRGYGKGGYVFNYCLINIDGEYLIENHLICIKSKKKVNKNKLLELYDKIIKSFNNPKTKDFITLYFTNDAINTTELQYVLPIYL